jgi:hypothetical protein
MQVLTFQLLYYLICSWHVSLVVVVLRHSRISAQLFPSNRRCLQDIACTPAPTAPAAASAPAAAAVLQAEHIVNGGAAGAPQQVHRKLASQR